MKRAILLFAASFLLPGCTSILYTTSSKDPFCSFGSGSGGCSAVTNKMYVGVRKDIEFISDLDGFGVLFPIIDFPFSLAMDTIFLPYTVPYSLSKD